MDLEKGKSLHDTTLVPIWKLQMRSKLMLDPPMPTPPESNENWGYEPQMELQNLIRRYPSELAIQLASQYGQVIQLNVRTHSH